MSYLIWLAIFACVPTIAVWYKYFALLSKYKATLFYCVLFALIIEIPWDMFAVKNTIWYFPRGGSLGFHIGILPIEEYFFMMMVTAFIVTIIIVYKYKIDSKTK